VIDPQIRVGIDVGCKAHQGSGGQTYILSIQKDNDLVREMRDET